MQKNLIDITNGIVLQIEIVLNRIKNFQEDIRFIVTKLKNISDDFKTIR